MERNRKCILCETVHASKQEMDEHMRSMLHHRELEKLKGRDCGHQCRVCHVTVASLTDYAGHISSPTHKQNVEAADRKPAGKGRDEDYFDQVLVDLIEKRKEQIRNEKEAGAAKLAKEEEDRKRKEEFQLRLKEAKERYQLDGAWQKPSRGFGGYGQQSSWYRKNRSNPGQGEAQPWHHSKQGKSATWHGQEPPNLQQWASGEFAGGGFSNPGWGNRLGHQGGYSGNPRNRLPWLSSAGSINGIYGRNNMGCSTQRGRPPSLVGPPPCPPPPSLSAQTLSHFQNTHKDKESPGAGPQNGEGAPLQPDPSSKKAFGSNTKLDKTCRWCPYPTTKALEAASHKDAKLSSSELCPKDPQLLRKDKPSEPKASKRPSRPETKPEQKASNGKSVCEKVKPPKSSKTKVRERSSSGSRSNSSQRDDSHTGAPASSNQIKPKKPPARGLDKTSDTLRAASEDRSLSVQAPPSGRVGSGREHLETLRKARQIVLEKKSSADNSRNKQAETAPHTLDVTPVQVRSNGCRQNAAKPRVPSQLGAEKLGSADSSQFLQSFQVSTSTTESSETSASHGEKEENRRKGEKDEASQAAEAAQSSGSEASRTSDPSGLSRLDLPPVLKRDLTKHISSKSKGVNHEPNLNIARRVRNLSESRRGDADKDSGLKPTVRQLISSSGSRRNVNWDQVYQEVRKKQDKGKGMPRFGIEMVPLEQEDQSQEEDDIPLLEGFQWESLVDVSTSGPSRKRSLSESSLAPPPAHSLLTPLAPKQTAQEEAEQRAFSTSEKMDGQHELEREEETLASSLATALQRCDSVLGDSSSGTELCEGQGPGKRRRAAGDAASAEILSLEHINKRRKVRSKKERLQIDQLLAVSLREDELSRSLQTVDASLIQARTALQAAYMEVQRLVMVKQQMTGEMDTLRNRRIQLLKGMQGHAEAPPVKLKEEKMDAVEAEPTIPSFPVLSSVDPPTVPSPAPAEASPVRSASVPLMPVCIKEEPRSPVHLNAELHPPARAHSTTSDPAPASACSPDTHPSPKRSPGLPPAGYTWESFGEPAAVKESSSPETMERAAQTTRSCVLSLPDVKPSLELLSQSRRDAEVRSVADGAAPPSFAPPSSLPLLDEPAPPSELKSGRRVRKLKKRKTPKKSQGTEPPESSDTELDGEALRPRWLRSRRRPSGGSQVSTSTQPSEDRDADVNMEVGEEAPTQLPQSITLDKTDFRPPKPLVELMLNLDSEESMEVIAACQHPHMDAPAPPAQLPDPSRPEARSLACNEVTSTSDMDICRSSESETQGAIILPKIPKTLSDASSDHGEDDLPSEGPFEGHQEAVNAMQIHNGLLYTCSGDRTVRAFDLVTHKCVGVFEGHSSKVSCLLVSAAPSLHHRLYSGSSDQTIRCYSLKTRELEQQFSLPDRVLCLHSRWKTLYAGLANGTVVTFNLKTNRQVEVFECHGPRAVSCLASTQEGARRILLVGSYDSTISVRDAKNGLLLRTLEGHSKSVLCMNVVNDLVFSGSSDQCVHTHNIHTGELLRVYEGHSHAVTVVAVLGKVMVTACLDKRVRVYDLQAQGQLQLYGGHSDMVTCMSIHQNMIYTGCYDGSVQAVKMNLLQNHRCWWHGCSLSFGLMQHLQHHLISDHAGAQTPFKCRWKCCEEFFCARGSAKQGLLVHMQKHAEEEADPEP
ncbi:zinc finger protein 106 isoform X1 [Takifugu rubripes]|uniref:Zinc finger protein 106 n=1 Tax=Takifugu rubripes TaxID=31033 RepID=H2T3K4_TAKRU|nr:zinc finger protein 106 isoform X1 [Takifugu rubripes]XP_029683764.1 zinc finger protein 106 isoform X1 [Takifugu rubripes]